jgi:hypothetical protein
MLWWRSSTLESLLHARARLASRSSGDQPAPELIQFVEKLFPLQCVADLDTYRDPLHFGKLGLDPHQSDMDQQNSPQLCVLIFLIP